MILQINEWSSHGISVTVPGENGDLLSRALNSSGERVALDLHVGSTFERDHKWIQMPERLVLRPHECIRIRVRELIKTPTTVFGAICSRASLTAEGLVVSNIKVDPNFVGYLEVAVFNAGTQPIRIVKDKAFASVWFGMLTSPVPDGEPPRVPTPTDGLVFRSWQERLRTLAPFILTGLFSVGGSIVAAVLFHLV